MHNQTIPNTILSIMIALAVVGISSDAKAGGPCNLCNVCGDGKIGGMEECDDGNTTPGDGCDAYCKEEPYCGDGYTDPGEQCDDGNNEDGDGCDAYCCLEPYCGDGYLDENEECDDGNNEDGDGCDAYCDIEPYCGDGYKDPGEECDDGNNEDGDGCDAYCDIEPYCGDGYKDPGEECDDGNNEDGDGCDAYCEIEKIPCCGDGYIDPGEECDDGNMSNGDGCDKYCQLECHDDEDGDWVKDCDDMCPGTYIPEGVPTVKLGTNRWALVDGDGQFDTKAPNGNGPQKSYSIHDTKGCSCEQIIAEQGLGEGHTKNGCSISAMDDWIAWVNQAAPIGGGVEFGELEASDPVPDAELDVPDVAPEIGGCNMGGESPHAPAWAFLGLMFAAVGLRRRT